MCFQQRGAQRDTGRLARRLQDSGRIVIDEIEEIDEVHVRRRLYWDLHDFGTGHGLEVGPLHRAMVRRDEADVSYVDIMDRDGLVAHYSELDHMVPVEEIPEIDYFLIQPDGRSLSLAEAVKAGAPFDWVMASHVIEHVPDVIGWLDDLAELTVDEGALVLAVPDKRYTFDLHRPPTTVGEMIAAHDRRDERPSVRAVYDHFASAVSYNHLDLWRGVTTTYADRVHTLEEACAEVQKVRDGEYVDSHVWLFTPDTFLQQMHELRQVGLSQWYVEELVSTPTDDIEFRVRMRRVPRFADPTGEQPREQLSELDRPEWVLHQAGWQVNESLQRRIDTLESLLTLSEGALSEAERQIEARRNRVRRLENVLAARTELIEDQRASITERDEGLKRLRSLRTSQADLIQRQEAELDRLRNTPWRRLVRRLRGLRKARS